MQRVGRMLNMPKPKDIKKWIKKVDTKKVKVEVEAIFDQTNDPLNIWVYIDSTASGKASAAVRNLFLTSESNVRVQITYFDEVPEQPNGSSDFAIIVAGSSNNIPQFASSLREVSVPAFIVVDDMEVFSTVNSEDALATFVGDYCAYNEEDEAAKLVFNKRIADWIVAVCPDKKLSLGYAFKFVARPIANDAINLAACENAVAAAVPFVRSLESTFFVLNQVYLLARIAALYGKEINWELLKEAAAVLVGALLANRATYLAATILPIPKFITRSAAYFASTKAIGFALIEYFEAGGDLSGVARVIEKFNAAKKNLVKKTNELVSAK